MLTNLTLGKVLAEEDYRANPILDHPHPSAQKNGPTQAVGLSQ